MKMQIARNKSSVDEELDLKMEGFVSFLVSDGRGGSNGYTGRARYARTARY